MGRPELKNYGSLDCLVFDGGSNPSIPVVICHGYGAPGTDLASLAPEWMSLLEEEASSFRFIFPAAPNDLAELGMPGGRAWWPINMARLAEAAQAASFDQLHDHEPPGIDDVRDQLCKCIKEVKEDLGTPSSPLVLGGFSQGAMLTLDTTLRGDIDPPELLIQFSGTLVCMSKWEASLTRLAKTTVYQSHGRQDPILPFSSATTLRDLIQKDAETYEFHDFNGPHTIDRHGVSRTAELMRKIVVS